MNIKDLDYFDFTRLNGHLASFVVKEDKTAWIECDGVRYDMDLANFRENEIDERMAAEGKLNMAELLKNDKPFSLTNTNQRGILRLINLNDEVWLFTFLGRDKHVCMISMGKFETTLGNL
ncbi:hypothetical protein GJ904_20015 [Salmonella enterica]|nr:hypothetical protein [Salmonella enterica subsp. enterica serovar Saintpaul]EEC1303351.1 hypothetical protein [Salmonella enterica]